MVTRADRGWLAGLFDGEGSVSVRPPRNSIHRSFQMMLVIRNKHPFIMEKTKRIINGILGRLAVRVLSYEDTRTHRGMIYHVSVQRIPDVLAVAKVIVNDLAGKREQVQVVIDHLTARGSQRGKDRTEEQIAADAKFDRTIKLLNARYHYSPVQTVGEAPAIMQDEKTVASARIPEGAVAH